MAKKFIMKLRRVSTHSYGVTIPKELVREFGWRERQKLELEFGGRKHDILIRDWEPAKNKEQ
jgi:bifunctional DNA-binding transcriptional regulator/antitoxin component of YhaV-PrlF toxin-antitoxin module